MHSKITTTARLALGVMLAVLFAMALHAQGRGGGQMPVTDLVLPVDSIVLR